MSKDAVMEKKQSFINHINHLENNNIKYGKNKSIQYFSLDHCVAWTFAKGKKLEPDKDDTLITPGPTKYTPKDESNKSPSWTINGERNNIKIIKKIKNPDIGQYNIKSLIGEGPKYTIRKRLPLDGYVREKRHPKAYKKLEVPGPGSYTVNSSPSGPRYTIGVKRYIKAKNLKSPCVGSYNLTTEKDLVVPCVRFAQGSRDDDVLLNKTALKYPPPGNYRYDTEALTTKTPKWSFSKLERFDNKADDKKKKNSNKISNVGPGSYAIPSTIGEGPRFTFPKNSFNHADALDAKNLERSENSPGPNTYNKDINYIASPPYYSIARLIKPPNKDIKNPNPSSYSPNHTFSSKFPRGPTWTFKGNADNKKDNSVDNKKSTPGPGFYDVKNDLFPQGPKFTMMGRKQIKPIYSNVGPGKYNIVSITFPREPVYSFSRLDRDEDYRRTKKLNFPGPTAYVVKDSKAVQDITFSKSNKIKDKYIGFPGPGQYRIPTAFDYINDMARNGGSFNPAFRYV